MASESEQSHFVPRNIYKIVLDSYTNKDREFLQYELDAWWTFAPEILETKDKGSEWFIEADDGFGEAFDEETIIDAHTELVAEVVWPPWFKQLVQKRSIHD